MITIMVLKYICKHRRGAKEIAQWVRILADEALRPELESSVSM